MIHINWNIWIWYLFFLKWKWFFFVRILLFDTHIPFPVCSGYLVLSLYSVYCWCGDWHNQAFNRLDDLVTTSQGHKVTHTSHSIRFYLFSHWLNIYANIFCHQSEYFCCGENKIIRSFFPIIATTIFVKLNLCIKSRPGVYYCIFIQINCSFVCLFAL